MIFTSRGKGAKNDDYDTYKSHRKGIWEIEESETERTGEKEGGIWVRELF
jgi:hypothetical protein